MGQGFIWRIRQNATWENLELIVHQNLPHTERVIFLRAGNYHSVAAGIASETRAVRWN